MVESKGGQNDLLGIGGLGLRVAGFKCKNWKRVGVKDKEALSREKKCLVESLRRILESHYLYTTSRNPC